MQTYRDFRPSKHDTAGLGLEDRQDWIVVPCSQTRDSNTYERSNFDSAVRILSFDDRPGHQTEFEVHRFGHWGPGWFEIILVHPDHAAIVASIEDKLENYPLLDEDHHSELQFTEALEAWRHTPLRERVQLARKFRFHIMAARRDELPETDGSEIIPYLVDCC